MKIDNIKVGDVIGIDGKIYQVLKIFEDADIEINKGNISSQRDYMKIELHQKNSSSLHPTHVIRHYSDTREVLLYQIKQVKSSPEIEKPRTRGGITEYKLIKILKEKDIECL